MRYTFPAAEDLASDKLLTLLDWHLGTVTRHTMTALRSIAADEILAGMPLPALPRSPAAKP